jgi:predicted GNAT family acetyltransferase
MSTEVTVTNNTGRHRYEAATSSSDLAGFVDYQETRELVVLTHTEVRPGSEGQ